MCARADDNNFLRPWNTGYFFWLYIDLKSKREKEEIESLNMMGQEGCICAVCKHSRARECIDQKCTCCISIRGNSIIGHSINPLQ
jgi:hypothetical protein